MRSFLAALPLLIVPVTVYAALALAFPGGVQALDAPARLSRPLLTLTTSGGGAWPVSTSDLLLAGALIVAFVEMLKGVDDRRVAIANHALSILLFVLCLAGILVAPAFANSTFFLITLMVLLDLVAGFIVTMGQVRGGRPPSN